MQISVGNSCPVERSGKMWREVVKRGDEEILLIWPWVGTHAWRGDSKRASKTRLPGQCSLSFPSMSLYMVWFLRSLRSFLCELGSTGQCSLSFHLLSLYMVWFLRWLRSFLYELVFSCLSL
jgi:hypothetical protein